MYLLNRAPVKQLTEMSVYQAPGEDDFGNPSEFSLQGHGHSDWVGTAAWNSYGTRCATGSADGKIKVLDRQKDGTLGMCDTWAAHSAEVMQIRWLPPTIHPNLLASIGADGQFKLWCEDPTINPLSGRRWNSKSGKPVYFLRSTTRAPYQSFDIKHNPETRFTYMAIIDKVGLLTVYENDEPEKITEWTEIDQFLACEKPPRGAEISMKVEFDPNLEPAYTAIREGVPRDALGLIVAAQETVRIWRTKVISHDVSLGAGQSREFYRAGDLSGHEQLVRDIAWAPGSIRGYDICATACKDGAVRVFEVRTIPKEEYDTHRALGPYPPTTVVPSSSSAALKKGPSGIGAGLATVRSKPGGRQRDGQTQQGQVQHVSKEVARLAGHVAGVWKVQFDDDGQMLLSTGDDGRLLLSRRKPDGTWGPNGELALRRSDTGTMIEP